MLGCSSHAKLPMKELSGLYFQYLWSCISSPDCYQDVEMSIACAHNHVFAAVISCLPNRNFISHAFVVAQLRVSPPAYCPSICCFTNHFAFEIISMAPHWQFFSTA